MRWTVRGIREETADAVRNLAYDANTTLGETLELCIDLGLAKAREHLMADPDCQLRDQLAALLASLRKP